MAKKNRLSYILWASSILFLLIPLIIIARSHSAYSEVTFFSTTKGSVTGVRFPDNKVWIISTSPEDGYCKPFKNVIEPWLRHQMMARFDMILLPLFSQNIIHDIRPFLNNFRPEHVFLCGNIHDEALKKDLCSSITNSKISFEELKNHWQCIPYERCTCTVFIPPCKDAWYEKQKPAIILLSLFGAHILISENYSLQESMKNKYSIHTINTSIIVNTENNTAKNEKIYSRETDGAITVRISQQGKVQVLKSNE